MTVSVIIPVHDGGDAFRACLAGLTACAPAPIEIIAVLDGGSDGSAAHAFAAGARVIELAAKAGPARARNRGAAEAAGDVLLFVDSDVVVPPDVVGRVAQHLRDDPGVAAVIGSYDARPADPGFLSQYRNLLHHYVHQTGRREASTFWSGCGAIRREVFAAEGGFNGGFSDPSVEDIEFGYRLKRAGRRIRLAKDLQVTHLKRWTALALVRTDVFARAVPWTRLILRSRVLPNDLNVKTSSRVSVALASALVVALAASPWAPWSLVAAAFAGLALLALNAGFYCFLSRVRGPLFALAAVPWHWVYFLCAGTGFLIGSAEEALGKPAPAFQAQPAREDPPTR